MNHDHALHDATAMNTVPKPRSPQRSARAWKRAAAAAALATLLAGCASPIEATRPALTLPTTWAEPAGDAQAAALELTWWRGFQSDELSRLVAQAQAGSADLRIAAERVRQAELAAQLSGASLFPQLSVGADTKAEFSDTPGPDNTRRARSTQAAVNISYEVDLWGRVAAEAASAQAALRASRYDLETARLSLTSGVANAYFQVLSLRMRIDVARNNLTIAEKVQNIVEARYRNGASTSLDVSRQRTAVLTQRSALLPLEVQERQAVSALALLLGGPPQGLSVQATELNSLAVPEVAPGLPSTLLTRRPDLASAEAQLAAADANVAAARAALLPTVSLTGSAGGSSEALLALGNPAYSVQIAASILRSLFDADSQRQRVQINESSRVQLVESYRRTVYTALKEVDDALGNTVRNREQERAQQAIRDEAQRALQLSELRYREGADNLSTLLDAQRTLFAADDQLAQIKLSRLTGAVDVFKALGGGWTAPR